MEAALPVTARNKRPAQDQEAHRADAGKNKKRARYEFDDINEYEMLGEIGEGAFGVVAKARDHRTGETVAVKWIRGGLEAEGDNDNDGGGLLPAAVREAGCFAACRGHPGIVQIKTVAADEDDAAGDDDLYIVMELVPDAARDAMRQLLEAAEKLHATGTIHRDINPDNILVAADTGELKLCGFGCATTPASRVACPEKPVGTPQYRAPEQMLSGLRRYGTPADMWALGCVMFELLAGLPLFVADETEDVLFKAAANLGDDIITFGVEGFDGTRMDHLSEAGREVLAGLLAFHTVDRFTAAEALEQRWFTEEDDEEADGFEPSFAAAAAYESSS
ncbi:unnamed protein product [Urochloa decumbens]|uniref:[RNA-polymerase]-subunit kinase n=1 Tax=Urochloa decumbens TaxID=240449 RepID=A0ABC8W5Q3_9POAL